MQIFIIIGWSEDCLTFLFVRNVKKSWFKKIKQKMTNKNKL